MSRFDASAEQWDSNPIHWERSKAIAKFIEAKIPLSNELVALEYGAGTAILSFLLKDKLKEIVLMDNSVEMVKVMEQKVYQAGALHLMPMFFNLETNVYNSRKFDLVMSQMVLHHVDDTTSMLEKFYELLSPEGYLALADLYAEDGSFHDGEFSGHLGFDPEQLAWTLKSIGFLNISYETCFVIKRTTPEGYLKEFPVFLLVASR
jgi:2-polyprenyl-3-methyl-5-hydroxy-6-metoxy-1,4-benzoquinol methylase